MDDNFSQEVKDVIGFSKEEAIRLGHDFIGTEHLILGIIRNQTSKANDMLHSLEVNLEYLKHKVETLHPISSLPIAASERKNLHLTKQAEKALKSTFLEARLYNCSTVDTALLLLCILRNENDPITKILDKLHINYSDIKSLYKEISQGSEQEEGNDPVEDAFNTPTNESSQDFPSGNPGAFDKTQPPSTNNPNKKSKTPVLDNFGRDLTFLAESDKLDP
ncbi:MAG: Clp protease N-terminal domain-containing protein, partial [Wenyingzhuangia sp.]